MISLIENGKSHPSIERLQYLADQLNVHISDLLSNYTKNELQHILQQAISLKENGELPEVQALLSPLLLEMDDSIEAGHIFKLYGEVSRPLEEWALVRAIEIYEKNVLEEEAFSCHLLIAKNHMTYHSVQTAVNQLAKLPPIRNARLAIECSMLKAVAYEALGDVAQALSLLEDALQLARTSLELSQYYDLLKLKALFHYGIGDHESARSIMNMVNTFVQTVQNEQLLAEHGIFFIHLEEFYEENEEIAAELAEEYVKYMLLDSPLSPEVKKEYIELAYNYKARALVKMEEFNEALDIFKQYPMTQSDRQMLLPMDTAIRELSISYEALCYTKLNDWEMASSLAESAVERLQAAPHSPYFKFAKKVLDQMQSVQFSEKA